MKSLIIIGALSLVSFSSERNYKPTPPTDNTLKLNWSADIGLTTYRSDIVLKNGKIYIGSNGTHYQDYLLDEGNGVFIVNAKNGNIIKQFLDEPYGDMDVNGILEYNNLLFIGNDNDEFICADLNGEIKYRLPVSGDIEHTPSLIQIDGKDYIVYATEAGEVTAIDPATGKTKWTFFHAQFDGWKPGDNRFIYKVKSTYINSGMLFFAAPGIADLNLDGVNDLVFYCNYNETIAINGKTGKKLWSHIRPENNYYSDDYHYTPIIVGKGNSLRILKTNHNRDLSPAQKEFLEFDRNGKLVSSKTYPEKFGREGLNVLETKNKVIIPFSSSIGFYDKVNKISSLINIDINPTRETDYGIRNSLASEPLIADQIIDYKGEKCAIILYQTDYSKEEPQACLTFVGLESKKVLKRFFLPNSSEFKPLIKDFTGDGNLDLLVSCSDGKLYCYNLQIANNQLAINY